MSSSRKVTTVYMHHPTWSALPKDDQELLKLAQRAARNAYARYSKFKVGSALHMESGEIVPGSNQENAAFPAGICAERAALHAAMTMLPRGTVDCVAIVVPQVKGRDPVTPCGICRQALLEQELRQGAPIRLLMGNVRGPVLETYSIESLLPLSFDSSFLRK
jgi:cytidine deaminase